MEEDWNNLIPLTASRPEDNREAMMRKCGLDGVEEAAVEILTDDELIQVAKMLVSLGSSSTWQRFVTGKYVFALNEFAKALGAPPRSTLYDPVKRRVRDIVEKHLFPSQFDASPFNKIELELITRLKESKAKGRADLARRDATLYAEALDQPSRERLFQASGVAVRDGLRWKTDKEIIACCREYSGWTELKNKKTTLHDEVKGRRLEDAVVKAHGWCAFSYVASDGRPVRSRGELIVLNMIIANGLPYTYDLPIPGQRVGAGRTPRRYDFFVAGVYVEILQNDEGSTRGSRRKDYADALVEKRDIYAVAVSSGAITDRIIFVSSDFSRGKEVEFAQGVAVRIEALAGVHLEVPPCNTLTVNLLLNLNALTADQVLDGVLAGVKGIADWQNNNSTLYHQLMSHPDFPEISETVRQRGVAGRDAGRKARWDRDRQIWRPWPEARALARSLRLGSQEAWHAYSKSGSRPKDIPSNPSKKYREFLGFADWLGY